MAKAFITMGLTWLLFDALDRSPCAIWSDEPGDEVCESCSVSKIEDVMLADGSVVRERACQESP